MPDHAIERNGQQQKQPHTNSGRHRRGPSASNQEDWKQEDTVRLDGNGQHEQRAASISRRAFIASERC